MESWVPETRSGKWFSGRIPESPRMFAKTIPVKKDGTSLIRTDTGKPFVVSGMRPENHFMK